MIDCAKEACPYVTSSDVSYDVFFSFFFLRYLIILLHYVSVGNRLVCTQVT